MLRIAFIDHAYHQVTKSADFFIDLLRHRFDVSVYYAGINSENLINDIVLGEFDIIVLWQTEYLAPFLIASNQRVVCVPMYDGTGLAPDHFWHHMRQTRVINFCQAMHNRLSGMGLTSLPVQYMKDPARVTPVTDYSSPRVVFWQRLPERGLTAARVRAIVGPHAHLHVHNAPDVVPAERYPVTGVADSVSHFNLDRNALADALDGANVFVCPRYEEGIGMAMLEAMTRGMVIIANDAPTHNEYITHGVDGWLINMTKPGQKDWPLDLTGTPRAEDKPRKGGKKRRKKQALAAATQAAAQIGTDLLSDGVGFPANVPGAWPAVVSTAGPTRTEGDAQDNPLARMGQAARGRAEQTYAGWLAAERDILDFIEETPRPTGLRLTTAKRNRLARETEMWSRNPHALFARMARWEAQGLVLRDRQRIPNPEKKRLRRRQTWAWRSARAMAVILRNNLRRIRQMVTMIRSKMR